MALAYDRFGWRDPDYNMSVNSATIRYSRPQDYGQNLDKILSTWMSYSVDKPTHRRLILKDTLEKFSKRDYQEIAKGNLDGWRKAAAREPKPKEKIIIENMDWGDATLKYTKKYGTTFACLNMTNPYSYPGGTYNLGGSGQEENMFRRTDCHFRISRLNLERAGPENSRYWKYWKYNQKQTDFINGMYDQVYLSTDIKHPRICIKGAETFSTTLGYELLDDKDIFPFYELRCAPIDRRFPSLPPKRVMSDDKIAMQTRIKAQFNTLKERDVKHVILGAFGCGSFRNNPITIANLYIEAIQRYIADFEVIVFAIPRSPNDIYPAFENNIYAAFESVFKARPKLDLTKNLILPDNRTDSQIAEEIAEEFLMLARDRIIELKNILAYRPDARVTIAGNNGKHNLATSESTATAWYNYYGQYDYSNRARLLFIERLQLLFDDLVNVYSDRVSYGNLDRRLASLDHYLVWGAYTDTYESTLERVIKSESFSGGQQAAALSPHIIGLFGIITTPGSPPVSL